MDNPCEPAQQSRQSCSYLHGDYFEGPDNRGSLLQHNPGLSMDWTVEEHSILEQGLNIYASHSNISRYAKIASQLPDKTVRDVALRCRWMTKKENSSSTKKKNSLSKKRKDKREKAYNPSAISCHLATQESDNGGVAEKLLYKNAVVLQHISLNLEASQVYDNARLFCQAQDNILQILNSLSYMPEMERMNPLPTLNVELFNYIRAFSTQS